ncbi:MAG: hypothetical protein CO108_27990 [Deltaproteobacteria bacterium CG_4_9_14_3_um_filter_63_12]|nr:MAG: hypothetical protein COW42_16195 [Deltaproteobacteria bacterium CG17_big_fil_post_rev_8_21_14_2_50_63_7]PJB34567.1 MAG: hypothetical protein CO108_27990 [Deltaproteobacteria bacterium CG_4_9_14_3_um_filter_63_12]
MQKRQSARTVRPVTKCDTLSAKRSVTLSIAGQRLSIRTDKDDEYLKELGEFVTVVIDELKQGTRNIANHQLYMLAVLNLADELFQAQDRIEDLKDEVHRRTDRLIRLLDETGEETAEES